MFRIVLRKPGGVSRVLGRPRSRGAAAHLLSHWMKRKKGLGRGAQVTCTDLEGREWTLDNLLGRVRGRRAQEAAPPSSEELVELHSRPPEWKEADDAGLVDPTVLFRRLSSAGAAKAQEGAGEVGRPVE